MGKQFGISVDMDHIDPVGMNSVCAQTVVHPAPLKVSRVNPFSLQEGEGKEEGGSN